MKKLETQANQSATAMQKIAATGEKLKTTGENISNAGQKLLPVTVAVTGMGAASLKTAAGFESSMSQVQATMGITKSGELLFGRVGSDDVIKERKMKSLIQNQMSLFDF